MSAAMRGAASPFAALLGETLEQLPEIGTARLVLSGKRVARKNQISPALGLAKGPAYDALVETFEQAIKRRRQKYMQAYRAANRDRLAAHRRAVAAANPDKAKALAKAVNRRWYVLHRDEVLARRRAAWAAKSAAQAKPGGANADRPISFDSPTPERTTP